MRAFFLKVNAFIKSFLLFIRIGYLLVPFLLILRFLANFALLTRWLGERKKEMGFSDFYKPFRSYQDRHLLYEYVSKTAGLSTGKINYFEFGVASAASFKWWLAHNINEESRFFGFDTFEGLPEKWALHGKGEMSFSVPQINDNRALFYKGLFQETVYPFLKSIDIQDNRVKVFHLDADLYSSTLFVLAAFAPYLRAGDIILFDEFNVPNHEFAAWNDFTRSFYVEYEVLGAVNNFYQLALRITKTPFNV